MDKLAALLIFLIFFLPAMSMPMTAQVVKLSYGVNYVDIDGDGTPDIITRSYLDNSNNNNADFYQVMVRRPVKSRRADNREWNLVPLVSGEKRYESFSGEVGRCIWNDVRFVREKSSSGRTRVFLYLFYSNPNDEAEHEISVERYRFEETPSGRTVGDPPMAFVLDRKQAIRSKRCGVGEADQLLPRIKSQRKG